MGQQAEKITGLIRRILWPAKVEPAQAEPTKPGPVAARRIIVRAKLTPEQRAELHQWAAAHGVKRYQAGLTEFERIAGATLANLEQDSGKWGK
jgi:hypothetical protein